MLTTVKEHMEIIKGLEGLGWQEILGFSNQQLLLFTKEIDTEKKRRILKQLSNRSMERNWIAHIRKSFQRL